VGQDELPAADMAALREAVLGFYDESVGPLVEEWPGRVPQPLQQRRLHWLTLLVLLP